MDETKARQRKKLVGVLDVIRRKRSPRVKWTILILSVLVLVVVGCYVYWDITDTTPGRKWIQTTSNGPFQTVGGFSSAEYKGEYWVVGGGDDEDTAGDVWHTSDGITWNHSSTPATVPSRWQASSAVFNGVLWVIGGQTPSSNSLRNDVWYSNDGLTWSEVRTAAEFAPRFGHSTVVFNDKIWVIGGNLGTGSDFFTNDIWNSDNGIYWQQVNPDAEFSPRAGQSSFVYRNKIWVIGGKDSTGYLNDVWNSDDGIHWDQVTSSAPFNRAMSEAVVYDNRMWVLYGSKVWWSRDGVTWKFVGSTPFFISYYYVFDNRLWVFESNQPFAGLWYTMPGKG
jgi:leucine-zipper-like transcriptional regulator 1